MKKTAKRLLSLVLSAVLVLSLLPTALIPTAQAAGNHRPPAPTNSAFPPMCRRTSMPAMEIIHSAARVPMTGST